MHLGHDFIESIYLDYIKPRVCLPLSLARSQANERNLYMYIKPICCVVHTKLNIGMRMFCLSLLVMVVYYYLQLALSHTHTNTHPYIFYIH